MSAFDGRSPRVLVVRPYTTRLRSRVFEVLGQAGLDMDRAEKLPAQTSDEDAVARVIEDPPDVLLIPFHAHRDANGERLDGLTFCRHLAEQSHAPVLPVLMPVSKMAAANLRLTSRSGEHASLYEELLRTRIMVLEDDALDDPQTVDRVIDHLRAHGVFVSPRPAS